MCVNSYIINTQTFPWLFKFLLHLNFDSLGYFNTSHYNYTENNINYKFPIFTFNNLIKTTNKTFDILLENNTNILELYETYDNKPYTTLINNYTEIDTKNNELKKQRKNYTRDLKFFLQYSKPINSNLNKTITLNIPSIPNTTLNFNFPNYPNFGHYASS